MMKARLLLYSVVLGIVGAIVYGSIVNNNQAVYAQGSLPVTYAEHEAFAKADGNNHCTNVATDGFSDYVWVSNLSGGSEVRAHVGDLTVGLRANLYGQVCPGAEYWWVKTMYKVGGGKLAPTEFEYPSAFVNGPEGKKGAVYNQNVNFNILGLAAGSHCYNTTITGTPNSENLVFVASMSAHWCIDLEYYRNWSVETRVIPTVNGVSIAGGNATVGDTVEWSHDARNNGPEVIMNEGGVPFQAVMGTGYSSSGNKQAGTIPNGAGSGTWRIGEKSSSHVIKAEDIGKQFCRSTTATPKESNSIATGGTATSTACFRVRSGFDLYPEVKIQGHYGSNIGSISLNDALVSPDDIKETIHNTGTLGSADRDGANPVTVSEFVVKNSDRQKFINKLNSYFPEGDSSSTWRFALAKWDLSETDNTIDACNSWLKNKAQSDDAITIICRNRVYYNQELGRYRTTTEQLDDSSSMNTTDGVDYGDLVCRMVSINGYSHNRTVDEQNQHRISIPACMVVSKQPKVQFLGADVRTDGDVRTTQMVRNGGFYGSWAEFAIMSSQRSVISASGASLSGHELGRMGTINNAQLTFANTKIDKGKYRTSAGYSFPKPDIGAHYTATSTSPAGVVDLNNLADGVFSYTGNVTLSGNNIKRRIVLKVSGTVTIDGDIRLANDAYTAGTIPQVIIIADGSSNIIIKNTVENVDAWLIAKNGYVSTCGIVANPTNWTFGIDVVGCNKRLVINGSVVAQKFYLRRTYGQSGTSATDHPGIPAETVNLRSDAYLYAASQSTKVGAIRTMYIKELPPRF